MSQVEIFNLFPGPGGSPQKLETGLDARVIGETPDIDPIPQPLPPVIVNEPIEDHFEGDAVERVVGWSVCYHLSHYSMAKRKRRKTFVAENPA